MVTSENKLPEVFEQRLYARRHHVDTLRVNTVYGGNAPNSQPIVLGGF